jgi:molybdenum cofactor cytidylyltransferase
MSNPSSPWPEAGIAGVLLAAGRSSRMGAESKLLLPHPVDQRPLLWHAAQSVLALGLIDVVVVVRPDLPALAAALAGLPVRIVPNAEYAQGMATSLRVGIAALGPDALAALVVLGDTPEVDPAVFAALLAAYQAEGRPMTLPVYDGIPGPPTLFSRAAFPALAQLTGDQGGRRIMVAHPDWVTRVPLPLALIPRDIDTPDDYRAYVDQRASKKD